MFRDWGRDLSKYDRTLEQLLSNPQELNSYSYVLNNPLKYKDPTGEAAVLATLIGLFTPTVVNAPTSENFENPGLETVIFVGSLAVPGGAAGKGANKAANVAVNKVGDVANATKGFKQTVNYLNNFGPELGTKMNQVAQNLKGQPYKFSNHAIQRIAEKIGVGNESTVLQTLKAEPFNYFHEGVNKIGYYNNSTKTFVGQIQDTKLITTVINNVDQNYISNLIKKSLK